MFLVKVLACMLVYYLVGMVANLVTAYLVINRLSDKALPYPGLLTELYRKHFEHSGEAKIYKKESAFKKFIVTQTLWPLNVRQTIQKGKNAEKELDEYILKEKEWIQSNFPQDSRDDADQRSNSSRDENNS